MKTNELNNGMKEVYAKPALEVEEMEVQWAYMQSGTETESSSGTNAGDCTLCDCNLEDDC